MEKKSNQQQWSTNLKSLIKKFQSLPLLLQIITIFLMSCEKRPRTLSGTNSNASIVSLWANFAIRLLLFIMFKSKLFNILSVKLLS